MERGVDEKFKSRYEEPAESLTTPVAAASMPAFPSGAGLKNARMRPSRTTSLQRFRYLWADNQNIILVENSST